MTQEQLTYQASITVTYETHEHIIEYRNFTHPNKEQVFNVYMLLKVITNDR
jgi:hypothetical protein